MITKENIEWVAKLMKIDLDDHDEHAEKIQKMIGYFDLLDSVELSDSFQRGLTVGLDSLRDDVHEPADPVVSESLKFGGGEHMRSPKLR